jgi:hypothetical protein
MPVQHCVAYLQQVLRFADGSQNDSATNGVQTLRNAADRIEACCDQDQKMSYLPPLARKDYFVEPHQLARS